MCSKKDRTEWPSLVKSNAILLLAGVANDSFLMDGRRVEPFERDDANGNPRCRPETWQFALMASKGSFYLQDLTSALSTEWLWLNSDGVPDQQNGFFCRLDRVYVITRKSETSPMSKASENADAAPAAGHANFADLVANAAKANEALRVARESRATASVDLGLLEAARVEANKQMDKTAAPLAALTEDMKRMQSPDLRRAATEMHLKLAEKFNAAKANLEVATSKVRRVESTLQARTSEVSRCKDAVRACKSALFEYLSVRAVSTKYPNTDLQADRSAELPKAPPPATPAAENVSKVVHRQAYIDPQADRPVELPKAPPPVAPAAENTPKVAYKQDALLVAPGGTLMRFEEQLVGDDVAVDTFVPSTDPGTFKCVRQQSNIRTMNSEGVCFLDDVESGKYNIRKRMRAALEDPDKALYYATVKRTCRQARRTA